MDNLSLVLSDLNYRLSWWAQRNSCSAENPQVDSFNNDVHWRTWNCSGKGNLLQHYKVNDMGQCFCIYPHTWRLTGIF
jgi:poly(3-hydroxybutyrate) depolymerase